MAYQVPDDYLQSQLIKAILENQPIDTLNGIVSNFKRGTVNGEKPMSLGVDLSTDAGEKAFWKKFFNTKIKIFNSQFSTYSVELSPLQIAVRYGSVELVKYLIEKYPETNKNPLLTDRIVTHSWMDNDTLEIDGTHYIEGSNALLLAIFYGNIDVANYLYTLAPTLHKQCDVQLNTPLHWTTRLGYRGQILLPTHADQNFLGQSPDLFSQQHYQQNALNAIRDARKKKEIQESIEFQQLLNNLEKHLHQIDKLIKELQPWDIHRANTIAALTNGIVTDVINAKVTGKALKEGRIEEYKNEMAKEICSLADYDASSKKWLVVLAAVVAITVGILIALTGFGIAAEVAGASFYAGFSAAASKAVVLGGAIELTTAAGATTTVAAKGVASAAWFVGIPVSGAAGVYFSDRYFRNQGPNAIKAVEDNVEKIYTTKLSATG